MRTLALMRALTYDGPYRVKMRNEPDPRIEHPQGGIVRLALVARRALRST